MTLQPLNEKDWSATHLVLSERPQLFDNPGVARLRRAVEDSFAARHLAGREVAEAAPGVRGAWEAIRAFAAIPALGNLGQLLDFCTEGLKPEGRMVLDLRSPSHWQAAFGDSPTAWPENIRDDPSVALCSPATLLAAADARGLSLVALEPYGGIWDNALLYLRLEHPLKWLRLLSWLDSDETFFELALLLEQQVLARLGTSLSGRYLVALAKRRDPAGNAAWAEVLAARETVLADSSLTGIEGLLQQRPNAFAIGTAGLLSSLRTRHFLFLLQQALAFHRPDFAFEQWLVPQVTEQLRRWQQAQSIDARNMAITRGWMVEQSQRLRQGVDLVSGLEYHLATALLRDYFKTHSGVSS
ncbi:hypothetical protein BAY1663_00356 [Pseudomonas sp. BAY1663]|uniref:hypothetical protein n=1 Tax=Pseudomonas sp. BAY1663 TaxID=1439940 RepID=UPI00042DED17|nr:hypothetical protein [Pseudomonas sp. BAY1663]EXF47097.1 hypothetical protein BAY1663_00356 [Pseudomonas sp. BAY1663]